MPLTRMACAVNSCGPTMTSIDPNLVGVNVCGSNIRYMRGVQRFNTVSHHLPASLHLATEVYSFLRLKL